MLSRELTGFQRKRLKPYSGLVIDVSTWSNAHNYHYDQQRLHAMSSHQRGVVAGLQVVAWNPPDNSIVIYPGVAVDEGGNTIIVSQAQRFYVRTEEKGMARIVIRYSEIAPEDGGGQREGQPPAGYVTEAFRIEELRHRPTEPYVELARVVLDGEGTSLNDAADPYHPQTGEIDTRCRTMSAAKPGGEIRIAPLCCPANHPVEGWDAHREGILNLARFVQETTSFTATLADPVRLDGEVMDCDLLCMTGCRGFSLPDGERVNLANYLNRGGVLFAEACAGPEEERKDELSAFRTSFSDLCSQLGQPLQTLQRNHPVFHSCHIFGSPPPGDNGDGALLGGEAILFSEADYGCAWDGGRKDRPLPRQVIRESLEFGANIAVYAAQRARHHAVRILAR